MVGLGREERGIICGHVFNVRKETADCGQHIRGTIFLDGIFVHAAGDLHLHPAVDPREGVPAAQRAPLEGVLGCKPAGQPERQNSEAGRGRR